MATAGQGIVNDQQRLRRAERLLGLAVTAVGLIGLAVSRRLNVTGARGTFFVDVPGDFIWGRQLAFNPLGALFMTAIGVLALGAVYTGRRPLVLGVSVVALALAVTHTVDLARPTPLLGSRAGNVAVLLALGLGLAAVELSARVDCQDPSDQR